MAGIFCITFFAGELQGVYLGQLDSLENRRLFEADTSTVYASSGHLLFARQGVLFAQPFDLKRMILAGEPFAVVEGAIFLGQAAVSASAAGPVVYRTGSGSERQFVWFDRSGKSIETVGSPDGNRDGDFSLSPDGRRIAISRIVNGNFNLWLLETGRGILSRLTSDATTERRPLWFPADDKIFSNPTSVESWIYIKNPYRVAAMRNPCWNRRQTTIRWTGPRMVDFCYTGLSIRRPQQPIFGCCRSKETGNHFQ